MNPENSLGFHHNRSSDQRQTWYSSNWGPEEVNSEVFCRTPPLTSPPIYFKLHLMGLNEWHHRMWLCEFCRTRVLHHSTNWRKHYFISPNLEICICLILNSNGLHAQFDSFGRHCFHFGLVSLQCIPSLSGWTLRSAVGQTAVGIKNKTEKTVFIVH